MNKLKIWLDDRTGYKALVHEALYENVPGGARWRYVWGSTLVFTFSVQVLTGLFLWMAYSPGSQSAWESVYHIQHNVSFGWLLRGIHHFTAQMMIVLLALHLMQVIIDGAYKAPREINFWLGLILMLIVLGLSLTGYLLPWDQKGYWATKVATNIMGITPFVGTDLQQVVVGGTSYGHYTLTRFFALHAGVLPALLIFFLVLHIWVFRRHGITVPNAEWKPNATFWPDQVLKDAVACLAVLATVLVLVTWHGVGPQGGAELGAPADPSVSYSAARPEWYFLFLFQFLKYFHGEQAEIVGAMVIPGAIVGFMFLMPFLGHWKFGHRFNIGFIVALLVGIGFLTGQAILDDRNNPDYHLAVEEAERNAERAKELVAIKGITTAGAVRLLREDSKTQGGKLFAANCAACHRYNGHDGTGKPAVGDPTAADLGLFGKREWLTKFLEDPAGKTHFGPTLKATFNGQKVGDRFTKGEMANWITENKSALKADDLKAVVEFLISQGERLDETPPNPDLVAAGKEFFVLGADDLNGTCYDCHAMRIKGELFQEPSAAIVAAPDLTGYGSANWLREFIRNPGHKQFYGENNAMLPFESRLSETELNMLVEWMLHRWPELPMQAPSTPEESAQNSSTQEQPASAKPATDTPQEPAPDTQEKQ